MKKIQNFFKNILNFPRMHFGHPRIITAFINQNFLKIWVFQGFSYTRLGHFGPKNFKTLSQNSQGVVKNEKNLEIFQKYSKLPKNAFWASQNHHNLQKPNFSQNLGFSGFPIQPTWPRFGHFEPILRQKNSKPLQKMPKTW